LGHGEFGRLYMYATVASALCLPLVGRVVDVMPVHRVIVLVMPVFAGAALLAGTAPTLLGISTGIGSTLFGVLWPEIYGVANLGAVRSIAEAVGVFATAAGPGLTGTLIDLGISLPTQMIFYGGYCLLGTAAMMIVSTQLQRRD